MQGVSFPILANLSLLTETREAYMNASIYLHSDKSDPWLATTRLDRASVYLLDEELRVEKRTRGSNGPAHLPWPGLSHFQCSPPPTPLRTVASFAPAPHSGKLISIGKKKGVVPAKARKRDSLNSTLVNPQRGSFKKTQCSSFLPYVASLLASHKHPKKKPLLLLHSSKLIT